MMDRHSICLKWRLFITERDADFYDFFMFSNY